MFKGNGSWNLRKAFKKRYIRWVPIFLKTVLGMVKCYCENCFWHNRKDATEPEQLTCIKGEDRSTPHFQHYINIFLVLANCCVKWTSLNSHTQFRIVSNCVAKFVTSNSSRRRFCESTFIVHELEGKIPKLEPIFNVINLVKLKTYLQEQDISASSSLNSSFALAGLYNSKC